MFDREEAFRAVEQRALALRVPMSTVCDGAAISRSTAHYWHKRGNLPKMSTIGRLERELDRIEKERLA